MNECALNAPLKINSLSLIHIVACVFVFIPVLLTKAWEWISSSWHS